jgi:hypothetical protein
MVVYELNVREFNRDFQGVVTQLDYLWVLGVNTLELMPVTNVREDVEWGYTPLGYFAPDERLGGVQGMKQLVNACHQRRIAVIAPAASAERSKRRRRPRLHLEGDAQQSVTFPLIGRAYQAGGDAADDGRTGGDGANAGQLRIAEGRAPGARRRLKQRSGLVQQRL